jgi:hypothetical protein
LFLAPVNVSDNNTCSAPNTAKAIKKLGAQHRAQVLWYNKPFARPRGEPSSTNVISFAAQHSCKSKASAGKEVIETNVTS